MKNKDIIECYGNENFKGIFPINGIFDAIMKFF